MKVITNWTAIRLKPENDDDYNLLLKLYEKIKNERKDDNNFDKGNIWIDLTDGSLIFPTSAEYFNV